jgi:hypothetical protein
MSTPGTGISFDQAQADMRNAYASGGPGVLVSGSVWLAAAVVAAQVSAAAAVWALLIGGMLIHPLGLGVLKLMGKTAAHRPENPLGRLALEGTLFMLLCIPLAYVLSLHQTEWFFQAMLLIIGGRYFTFATLYGIRVYWILGGALAVTGWGLFSLKTGAASTLLAGAAIELVFGAAIVWRGRRE